MPYVVVDNFSGGLDSRRHVLNSKPGTLVELKNAHITRGGEIEKRKAFVEIADFGTLGVDTFGLEATADGLYVFGSQPAPETMPEGIIYQRLVHPDMNDDGSESYFSMKKIVYSTVYGGKPFVIAEFESIGSVYYPDSRMAFYDGAPIKDFFEGFTFHADELYKIADKLASYFPQSGYSAVSTFDSGGYPVVDVTGPDGKAFTLTASVEYPITANVIQTQASRVGIPETISTGSFKITSGSEGIARAYRVLQNCYPSPNITAVRFGASSPTAADGVDITMMGTGSYINYNSIPGTSDAYDTGQRLAYAISYYINLNSSTTKNTSIYWNDGFRSGNDLGRVQILSDSSLGSSGNGKLIQIEFLANPTLFANISELIDTATIAVSPYNPTRYIATFGTTSGGSNNYINSIKVDGVEVLGSPVAWTSSNATTSANVVDRINSYTSSAEYVASINESNIVLTSLPGSGSSNNGKAISVTTEGSVIISGVTAFSGGSNAVASVPQINRVIFDSAVSGPQPYQKKYGLTIIDPDNPTVPIIVGASRVAGLSPNFSVTYKSKEYLGAGSTLYFSAVNDATKWDIYDTGSGFIDMSNNFGGREDLTGTGIYQNKLAVFSRRNVQLWGMDADPANNEQTQILANTGAVAPDSIVSVGSIDLMYLADNGVRSLRARENTDTAFASDIGSPIDSIILAEMEALDQTSSEASFYEATRYFAKAIIEPIDGRYWLALGGKIFVLSYFPGSNISAWSVYEDDQWTFIKELVTREDKVYVRDVENKIFVYGFNTDESGTHGNFYDDCEVVVELPYLDANKPATYKEAKGVDLTVQGEWELRLGFDHTNPTARDKVITVSQPTFALGKVPATGIGTHFGLRLTNQSEGYAKLANVIVHYDEMHSKHDAG